MRAHRSQVDGAGGMALGSGSVGAAVLAIAATTCGLLGVFVTSSLAPLLQADGIVTAAGLGVATAVFFGVSAVVAPIGGRLADRFGSVRVMRVGLVTAAAAMLIVAAGVTGWRALAVLLGLAGATNGAIQPSTNRYISKLVPPDRQGLAFGVKQAAIPMAILLGGLAVPAAAYVSGWRSIYYLGAAISFGVAVLMRTPTPTSSTTAAYAPARSTTGRSDRQLPRGALIVLAVGWGLASAGANALGAFFVLGAVHAGFATVAAGMLAVLGSLASIGTRIALGAVADRRSGRGFGVVAVMSGVGAFSVALLGTGQVWSYVLATLVGYGIGWGWAGVFNYAIVRSSPSNPGRTTGITQAGAGAGACLGPLAFGVLLTHSGYVAAWVSAGAALLVASAVIAIGRGMLPRSA